MCLRCAEHEEKEIIEREMATVIVPHSATRVKPELHEITESQGCDCLGDKYEAVMTLHGMGGEREGGHSDILREREREGYGLVGGGEIKYSNHTTLIII